MRSAVFALILAAPGYAGGQTIQADPARDLVLHSAVLRFLDGVSTVNQLETDLREYIRAFEAVPYKVAPASIEWTTYPQEQVFTVLRVMGRIIADAHKAFASGTLTSGQAAVKVAPFFLIWMGHGMDAPPNDPDAQKRNEELLAEIQKYAASTR